MCLLKNHVYDDLNNVNNIGTSGRTSVVWISYNTHTRLVVNFVVTLSLLTNNCPSGLAQTSK